MNTNKKIYLAVLLLMILFVSCSNDDGTEPTIVPKTYTPAMQGVIGEFVKANAEPTFRSGVIEDNANYTAGEQFYWVNGDKAKVLFFKDGDINAEPQELIYTAVVAEGVKSNSCQFTTQDAVEEGEYTVYALYPAEGWSKDETGYKASAASQYSVMNFYQNDLTSQHLGIDMFMKTEATNVTVGTGDNNTPINLSFKHLSSVVRFHITSTSNPAPIIKNISFQLDTGDLFTKVAYLSGGIDDSYLTPISDVRTMKLFIEQELIDKGTVKEFDAFMPVLATRAPVEGEKFLVTYQKNIGGTSTTRTFLLFFNNDVSFLKNGFEAGKSYYFNVNMDR